MIATLLLGGSFNPAHAGHRHITLQAMRALGVDEAWWLVSPGNPLKADRNDMAPLPVRVRSAARLARYSRIRVTAIEQQFGTPYTFHTLRKLVARYPARRFIWLMGSDNLAQFTQWRDWRNIARLMPIAVIIRPGYDKLSQANRAMSWFRGFIRPKDPCVLRMVKKAPLLAIMHFRADHHAATTLRHDDPNWNVSFSHTPLRDPLTHRMIT